MKRIKGQSLGRVLREYGILLVLLFEVAFFGFTQSSFFTASNFIVIIRQAAPVCICGTGTLIVLVAGGFDISIGWMISATGMLAAYLMTVFMIPAPLSCSIVYVITMGVGCLMGVIIAKLRIAPFVVTLAFMGILKGFSYLITNGRNLYGLPDSFVFIGQGQVGGIPMPIILMIAALLLGWFILTKTSLGQSFYAVGGNEEAAKLSGINTTKIKILTYMLGCFFAATAGLVMLARMKTASPTTGSGYEFNVLTACIIGGASLTGGKGRIYNVIVGALTIAVLNNGLIFMQVSEYIQVILKGVLLLLAVIYDVAQRNSDDRRKMFRPRRAPT
ncbi:MAG: ABC transporter permease [Dehalococcoidia bacterium]|jgi:ribose/xylose/arabinose/galactoside ABC-type transport system permease subunit